MPSPVTPDIVKTMLPTTSGSRCQRMKRLINFPLALYNLVSYLFKEDGFPTDEFKTDICALGCIGTGGGGGGGTPNPNMPAPTGVNATDGTFSDKIRVSWNAVTPPDGVDPVTEYDIYRSLSTNIDPNEATLVGSVDAPTTIFDDLVDEDLAVGSTYNYWVRSKNETQTSAFSSYDIGSAGEPSGDLAAITDLACTQGFATLDGEGGSPISLVFTPPAGATKFDVYRNTVNDFGTATKIITEITAQSTQDHYISTQSPDQCWNNIDTIVIYHFPPNTTQHYFFWVVAKKDAPPAVSAESNEAEGWVRSYYSPFLGNAFRLNRGESATEGIEFTGGSIRVVLVGSAGGGAGGSQIYGGGGGGGSAVVIEEFAVSPGDIVSLVSTPDQDDTGNAAALNNGAAFTTLEFKINGVTKLSVTGGGGGVFTGSGGGAGGAGGVGTGTTSPTIYNGHDGLPGVGTSGGGTGYHFGNKRYPPAWFNGFTGYDGNGTVAQPGGGSKAAPGTEVLAVGGFGRCGYAVIVSETL